MSRLIFVALILFALASCEPEKNAESVPPPKAQTEIYGIDTLGKEVIFDTVRRDEFLGIILQTHGLNSAEIHKLAILSDSIFPVTKIHVGQPYIVIRRERDSSLLHLVYEIDKIDYVIYDFTDSIAIKRYSRPIEHRKMLRQGIIEANLSQTLEENGAPQALAVELADVFQWSVNFFKLQKGDAFKVLYNEVFVEEERVGIDSLRAAVFNHRGKDFYAFHYAPLDSNFAPGYFDDSGRSTKKYFLQAPLKYSRISSRYNLRRFHPIYKRVKPHLGTDFAARRGTPIWSTADGYIERIGYTRGNGKFIKVKHNDVYSTQYLHMSRFAKGMAKGVPVKQGETIGYVGSTGAATGPHVCYRFWKNGKQVDPFKQNLPKAKSLEGQEMERYLQYIKDLKLRLDNPEPI